MADPITPATPVAVIPGGTPGWKTTEFWAGVVGAPIFGLLLLWLSTRTADVALIDTLRNAAEALLGYGPLGYVLTRGLRKFGTGEPTKTVPVLPPPSTPTESARVLGKL